MRNKILTAAALLLAAAAATAQPARPSRWVDPLIGTGFTGHAYPGAVVPHGFAQVSPDTRLTGWDGCSGYHYDDTLAFGFSHTHLSGTGCSDYGDVLLMPVAGGPVFRDSAYASPFRKANERAAAGYYAVTLDKPGVRAELTATARAGAHRYTYPGKSGELVLDLAHRDVTIESGLAVAADNELRGFRRSRAWARDQHIYFVARFSAPVGRLVVKEGDSTLVDAAGRDAAGGDFRGQDLCAWMSFPKLKKGQLTVKVGISAVSVEGALRNLEAEIPGWSFDAVADQAARAWDDALGRITVDGGTEAQKRAFYTALYHCLIVPNVFNDVDGQYRGMDNQVHPAPGHTPYTVFSLWDTYRAWHPLMTIIDQRRAADFVNTFLDMYRLGGRLPVWELSANETDCMIGYHSVSVIADAWAKGIRGFDAPLALEAMKHSAGLDHLGLAQMREYNFIPGELEHESVSKTLEYAYDDWCVALLAKDLGDTAAYAEFSRRAQAYRNLFDPETRLMRPRIGGRWKEGFDPTEVDQHFTEANSWQYSFYAPHDIDGLARLHGGPEALAAVIDSLFAASSDLAGREQVDITGLIGQYAHGNEPSHHIAYLYDYLGQPWKTQRMARRIMDEMYTDQPAGLIGNEDCGQMSAWLVMSAMGFYPVCPGSTQYAIGSPLFGEAQISLESGRRFRIVAEGNAPQNIYIQSAALNGAPLDRCWLDHAEVMAGGELRLVMGPEPNKGWGSAPAARPATRIDAPQAALAPVLTADSQIINDTLTVTAQTLEPGARFFLRATPDGGQPGEWAEGGSVALDRTTVVEAYAVNAQGDTSAVVRGRFSKTTLAGEVTLKGSYSNAYAAGGDYAIVDGARGSSNFRLGHWQGYHGQDFEAVVDLGQVSNITYLGAGFLQDARSWIMLPRDVTFAVSDDGEAFTDILRLDSDLDPYDETSTARELGLGVETRARYVRVVARNFGPLPKGHESEGKPAWIFIDEVVIRTE